MMKTKVFTTIIEYIYIIIAIAIFASITSLFWFYYPYNWYLLTFPFGLLGFATILLTCKKFHFHQIHLSDKRFFTLVSVIASIVFTVQIAIAFLYPFRYDSDLLLVRETAINIAEQGVLGKHYGYFQSFPNNLNITLVCAALYRIGRSWEFVTSIGALMVNLSAILTSLTVRNYTKSNTISFVTLILAEFILSFTFIAFPPYTHNGGIIFPVLQLFLYSSPLKRNTKIILLVLTTVFGLAMKATTIIPVMAIVIIEMLKVIHTHQWKPIIFTFALFVILYSGTLYIQNHIWNNVGYIENTSKKNDISYFLLLGQSTNSGGRCDGEYATLATKLDVGKSHKDSIFIQLTKENVVKRGVWGNVKFYLGKLSMCWGDSSFSGYKTSYKNPQMQKFQYLYVIPRQILWYCILILMCIAPFICRKNKQTLLYICLIGVALYLLLFEAESRYVFMFVPLILSLACINMHTIMRFSDCS